MILASLERKEGAIAADEDVVRLYPPERDALHGPTHVEQLARIYARVNKQVRAFEQIDRFLSILNIFAPRFFDLEPSYKALRDHPRNEKVVGKYRED